MDPTVFPTITHKSDSCIENHSCWSIDNVDSPCYRLMILFNYRTSTKQKTQKQNNCSTSNSKFQFGLKNQCISRIDTHHGLPCDKRVNFFFIQKWISSSQWFNSSIILSLASIHASLGKPSACLGFQQTRPITFIPTMHDQLHTNECFWLLLSHWQGKGLSRHTIPWSIS